MFNTLAAAVTNASMFRYPRPTRLFDPLSDRSVHRSLPDLVPH